jgi:uroporphyrin-III C-methyltransferase/precorrin-2 dehydrogenase/sirohydrochlorin ferrochelatase
METSGFSLEFLGRIAPRAGDGGRVVLVGAGPGDPELLTLRAARELASADVVVHDRLVSPKLLALVPPAAARIDVGKAPGRRAASQAQINALLLAAARGGYRVVRLKGGDPMVFGRGGEELAFLRAHGVPVDVVPGISAALGCAAAAAIPLTHRDLAHSLILVSGTPAEGAPEPDWTALARPGQTVAIYMGVRAAARIAEKLIAAGCRAATPVAVIENGTRPEQRVITGRLDKLGALMTQHSIRNPALLVIGEVAALAQAAACDDEGTTAKSRRTA